MIGVFTIVAPAQAQVGSKLYVFGGLAPGWIPQGLVV